jgi:hypothetical protein
LWPIATEIHIPWHVRYQVKSGLVVLNVSFVARDPQQTVPTIRCHPDLLRDYHCRPLACDKRGSMAR